MTTAASAPSTGYVPVQLTAIVPVRVCDAHGEYFETEIDLDSPLRVLQLAVEDFFKVKPEVQLLLHNRQQVNPELTLRENGCLLLKGDPYVKLTLVTKRGPVLNLICHSTGPHAAVYPIAVHERSTVWEAKRALCVEMAAAKKLPTAPAPQQLRLLWRYLELNDKAELHYYRIPTNSVLTVRVRKGIGQTRSNSPVAAHGARPASASPAVGGDGAGHHQAWARLRQQRGGPLPLPMMPYDPQGQAPPAPPPAPTSAAVPAGPPPPVAAVASAEVMGLRRTVTALQDEMAALRAEVARQQASTAVTTQTASQTVQQSTHFTLAASHRIQELEETVSRFQAFLQRAIALIP